MSYMSFCRIFIKESYDERSFFISSQAMAQIEINDSPPPYKPFEDGAQKFASYGAINSPGRHAATSTIFCVPGNKNGVARCCDDLHAVSNEDETNSRQGLGQSYRLKTSHATYSSGSLEPGNTESENGIDKKERWRLIIASVLFLLIVILEIIAIIIIEY